MKNIFLFLVLAIVFTEFQNGSAQFSQGAPGTTYNPGLSACDHSSQYAASQLPTQSSFYGCQACASPGYFILNFESFGFAVTTTATLYNQICVPDSYKLLLYAPVTIDTIKRYPYYTNHDSNYMGVWQIWRICSKNVCLKCSQPGSDISVVSCDVCYTTPIILYRFKKTGETVYSCLGKSTLTNLGYIEETPQPTDGTGIMVKILTCPVEWSCTTCETVSSQTSCQICAANRLLYSTAGSLVYDKCIESKYLTEVSPDNSNRGFYREEQVTDLSSGMAIAKACPTPCKLCSFVQSSVSCDLCFPNFLRFSSGNNLVIDKCIDKKYLFEPSPDNTYDNVHFKGFFTTDSQAAMEAGTATAQRCSSKCRTCQNTASTCTSCPNKRIPIF